MPTVWPVVMHSTTIEENDQMNRFFLIAVIRHAESVKWLAHRGSASAHNARRNCGERSGMRFPHRRYRDHLTPRAGLDNVSARPLYLGPISRGRIINCVPAELLNCREIVGTKRTLAEREYRRSCRRRKRRVTRLPHHRGSCRSRRKGQHVPRD